MKLSPLDMTLAAMFAALCAIGANVTSMLVIGGVPVTLQTFFCILAGLILGSRLGAFSMIVYTLIGLAGAPIFARMSGGLQTIFDPTFGFILSFILAAYAAGKIAETHTTRAGYLIAAFTGLVINYGFGTNWMYAAMKWWAEAPEGFSYGLAWSWMLVPLPKDIFLTIVAGLTAPRIRAALKKTSRVTLNADETR